jgi:hypothetical protein
MYSSTRKRPAFFEIGGDYIRRIKIEGGEMGQKPLWQLRPAAIASRSFGEATFE